LGIGYGLGNKDAAKEAILAADALGGSPTAYQLAGRYAFEEADATSAAGLYARAFAMLSPSNPREQSIRKELAKDFNVAVTQMIRGGVAANTDIASFDIVKLPTKGSSSWYPLAVAANLHNFGVSGDGTHQLATLPSAAAIVGLPRPAIAQNHIGVAVSADRRVFTSEPQQSEIGAANIANRECETATASYLLFRRRHRAHQKGLA
jgi:hypothetical protein